MKSLRPLFLPLLGVSVILSLTTVPGCSDGGTVSTAPKAGVESKRDELQKKTQSGVPGKKAPANR